MKKWMYILGVLLGVVGAYRFAKKKGVSLGKLTAKPPKVRLVYSRIVPESERVKISSSK